MKATIREILASIFNPNLRKILKNPISIGSISEPSENLQCTAVRLDEHAINMINKPCERAKKYVIIKNPYHIKFIENPSEELQILAVSKEPDAIELIENPCLRAKFACIYSKPENIKYIKNPDKEILVSAIQKSPCLISELENPCEAAQLTAVLNTPETIFSIPKPGIRTMLVAVEKLAGFRIYPSDKNLDTITGIITQCYKLKENELNYKEYFKNEILKLKLNDTL